MEITDPATPRRLYNKPDQESCGGNVDGRSSASSSSRSFDCTFCKRGFSNAQALGGHMNLHRKDKTRLDYCTSPCGAQFPFDVAVAADGIACMSPSPRASKSLGEDEVEKQGMGIMPGVVDAELDLELRLGR